MDSKRDLRLPRWKSLSEKSFSTANANERKLSRRKSYNDGPMNSSARVYYEEEIEMQEKAAIMVQKNIRKWKNQNLFHIIIQAAIMVQKHFRKWSSQQKLLKILEAAIMVQKHYRKWSSQKMFQALKQAKGVRDKKKKAWLAEVLLLNVSPVYFILCSLPQSPRYLSFIAVICYNVHNTLFSLRF
jgi:hypothetical protein